jgi:hypothetical protein
MRRHRVAMANFADRLCYLTNALAVEPPIWVHEGEVERCSVAALPVKEERTRPSVSHRGVPY